ncbi:antibiotic biosynthesis monooxygenase family protein [Streptomyces tendae]|uniref:antibiotic biosynthesis monooxygenase family protein n=1 Tax=Streptomyces tendae TaxID=1932 RepID=UPI00370FDC53
MTASVPDEGPITFINVFDIAEEEIDTFVAKWEERAPLLTSAEGFICAELHRAYDDDTRFRVVNVTKWQSHAHFAAATRAPEFQAGLAGYQQTAPWTPYRGFYRTAAKFD